MWIQCICGNVIRDNTDALRYKGYIIADQDLNDIYTWFEKLENTKDERKKVFEEFDSFWCDVTLQAVYQCPECGRLYMDGNLESDRNLYSFMPMNEETNRHLLSSYLGEDWKGHITAIWDEDVKEYCPHKGMIYIDINKELSCYCYKFDDYKQFEEKYYALLDEWKDLCLKYSTLRCNGTIIHEWEL